MAGKDGKASPLQRQGWTRTAQAAVIAGAAGDGGAGFAPGENPSPDAGVGLPVLLLLERRGASPDTAPRRALPVSPPSDRRLLVGTGRRWQGFAAQAADPLRRPGNRFPRVHGRPDLEGEGTT